MNAFIQRVGASLAHAGIVTVVIDPYRFDGPPDPEDYTDFDTLMAFINTLDFVRATHDMLAGVEHARALPTVDPERVGVWGYCTGATLALLAACVDQRLAGSRPVLSEPARLRPARRSDAGPSDGPAVGDPGPHARALRRQRRRHAGRPARRTAPPPGGLERPARARPSTRAPATRSAPRRGCFSSAGRRRGVAAGASRSLSTPSAETPQRGPELQQRHVGAMLEDARDRHADRERSGIGGDDVGAEPDAVAEFDDRDHLRVSAGEPRRGRMVGDAERVEDPGRVDLVPAQLVGKACAATDSRVVNPAAACVATLR